MGELLVHSRKLTRGLKRPEELGGGLTTVMATAAASSTRGKRPGQQDRKSVVGIAKK